MTKLAPVAAAPAVTPSQPEGTKIATKKSSSETSPLEEVFQRAAADRAKNTIKDQINALNGTDFCLDGLKLGADKAYRTANGQSLVDPKVYATQQKAALEDLRKTQHKLASLSLDAPAEHHEDSHIGVTLTNDALHTAHHAAHHHPLGSRLSLPARCFQIYTAAKHNDGSKHLARDVMVDLTVEAGVAGAMAAGVGGTAAGAVLFGSHGVQHLRDHTHFPPMEELTRLSLSRDLMEREMARTWFEAKAAADILAFPADLMHAIGEKAKEILDQSDKFD